MEKVTTLIQKLQQQLEQKATTKQLLVTVQLLQSELLFQKPVNDNKSTSKVAVIMPAAIPDLSKTPDLFKEVQTANSVSPDNSVQPVLSEEKIVEVLQVDEKEIEDELEEIRKNADFKNKISTNARPALLFDPVEEVPTLTHQTSAKEINETAGNQPESLNDRLKQNKTELSDKLNDGPIRDLKKGIGVNDRFLFINELFRGDEAMYERSIKTINNFSILPEAEYWIKRELKLKIGWNENDSTVKQFDQLVRRRFS